MSDHIHPMLQAHRNAWARKPGLRAVYTDYYRRMVAEMPTGKPRLLEIGAGSGHSVDVLGEHDIHRLDILPTPWVDTVADAHDLPFEDGSFDGIFFIDVLHHLSDPVGFFREASRVLRPGGRIAMIEPGITPISWLFYNFLHQEPVDMGIDPLEPQAFGEAGDPFLSNQAIPTLLFKRQENRIGLVEKVPELHSLKRNWLSLFAFPMSGGFKGWSLLSEGMAAPILRLEEKVMPALGLLMAFRLFVVLEKRSD